MQRRCCGGSSIIFARGLRFGGIIFGDVEGALGLAHLRDLRGSRRATLLLHRCNLLLYYAWLNEQGRHGHDV